MIADEQTHALPEEPKPWSALRISSAMTSRAAFAKDLLGHLNIVQGHYGKLFEGDPTGSAKLPDVNYGAGPEDPRLLDHLATLGFKKPVDGRRHRAAMDGGRLSRAAQRGDPKRVHRIHPRPDRRAGACRRPRRCGHRVRPFPRRVAARRPADFAVEPEPRPGGAGGADPRRRAPARRHAGAPAADHGRADRPALLRRDAGPEGIVGAARRRR